MVLIKSVFQFYLSSIKREPTKPSNGNQSCFNSTLVQLKEIRKHFTELENERFNSTLVQLKDDEKCTIDLEKRRFQFYLSSIKSLAIQ